MTPTVLSAHYSITLPADYDMTGIVRRVADRSAPWDRRPGLLMKAFCVSHAADAGHNSYAPFYIWADPAEFGSFLTGAEYAGLCAAFGPVPVHTGTVLQQHLGTGETSYLLSESEALGPLTDLREAARAEEARHRTVLEDPAVHSHITELDPATMTVTRRTLLHEGHGAPQPKDGVRVLRVLHLSRPPQNTTS
ncbi:DUF4865 family protein [Streptomyces sp. NPDC060048]|uniref:DUF4865 family protein n=1 Tax=unclassified Streptomyces TaxID=2593676 RepID=UPI0036BEC91D